jgi:ribosome biogenesis protein BRX1
MQELIVQIFSVQDFKSAAGDSVDRVLGFSQVEGKVYLRNYQVSPDINDLKEIGPRCVLTPLKLLKGLFNGEVVFRNGRYLKKSKEDFDRKGKKG